MSYASNVGITCGGNAPSEPAIMTSMRDAAICVFQKNEVPMDEDRLTPASMHGRAGEILQSPLQSDKGVATIAVSVQKLQETPRFAIKQNTRLRGAEGH